MRNWLLLSALVVFLDQWSKKAIVDSLALGNEAVVTPFFNLVLAYNKGAAFSFLNDAGGWQRFFFMGIAIGASVLIVSLLKKHPQDRLFCLALSLILGGALGNLWDRITLGKVVDFLDFYVNNVHFPAFNLADSAITLGAAILFLDSFKKKA